MQTKIRNTIFSYDFPIEELYETGRVTRDSTFQPIRWYDHSTLPNKNHPSGLLMRRICFVRRTGHPGWVDLARKTGLKYGSARWEG